MRDGRETRTNACAEIHENEPGQSREAIAVVALRIHNTEAAAEHRRTMPALLAGIVGEVPGAELEMAMVTDAAGMVAVELTTVAGAATSQVTKELAAALYPIAETEMSDRTTDRNMARWAVVPDSRAGALGFGTGESPRPASIPWSGDADPSPDQIVELLANHPGEGVQVRVRPAHNAGAEPRWEVHMAVITNGKEPSLRLRSALRRRLPGLRVSITPSDSPVWLQVDDDQLPAVFAIPVAARTPVAGTYTAVAAPIPVSPVRTDGDTPASGIRIGNAVTRGGHSLAVELSIHERLRHIHVLGQTGTGKSSALAGIARQIAAGGDGALIADPHGHLCDRILAELPDSALDRVWVIRCGDVDNPVPLNPLAETDPVRRDISIAAICATFQYLFDKGETGIVGPRFHERVAMTLRALMAAHGTRASLLDVPAAAADGAFMARAVSESGDDRLRRWWSTDRMERSSNEYGQVLAWVNSKFESFSSTAAMRGILGSGADAIDFVDVMDSGRIILLNLSKADVGEAASRLLGFMYMSRIWQAALRRARPERPFTVVVDEAHTLIAGALTNMLAEGRKFGLSVILAHQYLDQLDSDLRPAVDGNVATTIAFRSAVGDAASIHRRFGGLVDASVFVTLPDLSAVSLRAAMPGPAYPYTLMIDHNTYGHARTGDALRQRRALITEQTRVALVDPHRDITMDALQGVSNLTSLATEARRPTPRLTTTDASGPRAVGRGPVDKASFLDEWLDKRKATPEKKVADARAEDG